MKKLKFRCFSTKFDKNNVEFCRKIFKALSMHKKRIGFPILFLVIKHISFCVML